MLLNRTKSTSSPLYVSSLIFDLKYKSPRPLKRFWKEINPGRGLNRASTVIDITMFANVWCQEYGVQKLTYVNLIFKGKISSVKLPVVVRVSSARRTLGEHDTSLDPDSTSATSRGHAQERKSSTQTAYSLLPQETCGRLVDESSSPVTQRPIKRFRIQHEISNSNPIVHSNAKSTAEIQEDAGYHRIYDNVLENIGEGDEFKCGQCNTTFTQRSLLNNHLCTRMPCKPYRCGHCHESFAQPKELRMHAIIHVSEKPFKCGYCLRSFSGATTLNNHVRTHTGEKPFLCEQCGKYFSQASQLSRHRRICLEHVD